MCARTSGDGGNFGMCVPTTARAAGEICEADDDCAAGLACALYGNLQTAGECATATERARGAPCDDDAQCASGTCSNQVSCA